MTSMTRVDHPVPHPTLAYANGQPTAGQGSGGDFLDHLRPGKDRVREDAGHSPGALSGKRAATSDGQTPDEATGQSPNVDASRGGASFVWKGAEDTALSVIHRAVSTGDQGALSRIFEQHWFANGYLSFVASANPATTPTRDANLPSAPLTNMPESPVVAPRVAPSTENVHGLEVLGWPVVVDAPGGNDEPPPRSVERLVRAFGSQIVADRPWAARLLRVSVRSNGAMVVWARDYALSEPEIGPLVEQLKRLARNEGIVLEQIVVNGTVAWCSQSIQGEV